MSWPRTMADLLHLALTAVSVAQGFVYIGLVLLLIAFIWWIFACNETRTRRSTTRCAVCCFWRLW